MTQITVDSKLSTRLHELTQSVQLCDPSGRVLGRFVPAVDMADWEPMTLEVSEEELDRRSKSTDWVTTEQVFERLRKLEKENP